MSEEPAENDTVPRLSRKNLKNRPGIVHLGPGAFFKAFTAIYTDDLMQKKGGDWGIIAVSMRSDQAMNALGPQECCYTSISLSDEGLTDNVIGSISDVLVLPREPERVLSCLSDPSIRILSLTVTEKGYFYSPATGGLRLNAPEIQTDLQNASQPSTVPGLIVQALRARWKSGIRPFTVLSCDNLPDNGATVRRVVLDYADALDPDLAAWIAREARFPATMVDRITPATTEQTIADLQQRHGYFDPACVQHESFRQWVIEDDFVDRDRPDWDAVGAQFVKSVTQHEAMKLRCLNGTHSALAYLGYLAGFETIFETVSNPTLAAFCDRLWRSEILPTLQAPEGEDLDRYVVRLMERYKNPRIQHRTWQIAMDGSQKLPQRLLGTLEDRLNAGTMPQGIVLSVAAWMHFVSGVDASGAAIDVRDPRASELRACTRKGSARSIVRAFLDLEDLFAPELCANELLHDALSHAHEAIDRKGVLAAAASLLDETTA